CALKKYLYTVIALVLCMLASGAGADTNANDSQPKNTGDANDGQGEKGGNVTMPIEADPIFNPWHPNAYAESNVVNRVIFQGLTKPGKDNLPAPALATEWNTSNDGLTWTFDLKEDVKWHDGEEMGRAHV